MNPDAEENGTERVSEEPLAEASLSEAHQSILLLRASKRMYELKEASIFLETE
jgi:hypothetical protein